MSPEQQRLDILTYMGWSNFSRLGRRGENGPETALRGTSPEGVKGQYCPNPLTNLNYMYEVEKTLYGIEGYDWPKHNEFCRQLYKICKRDKNSPYSAYPTQRVEAFLVTLEVLSNEN